MKNKREIAERSFVLFCLLVSLIVDLQKCTDLKMYTTNVHLSIYQPSLKKIRRKMAEKSEDAGGGKEEK